jgi:hypothetical protein
MKRPQVGPFVAATIGVLSLGSAPARATTITLTFQNLVNETVIGPYFNGQDSSNPNLGVGPNDGIVFSPTAEELRPGYNGNAPSGGTGKFSNNPSGQNGVLYFAFSSTAGAAGYMNDASGFTSLTSVYSLLNNNPLYDGAVTLWSGLNGTGTQVGSTSLNAASTAQTCTGTYAAHDEFCTWSSATVTTSSGLVAESATFGPINPGSASGDSTEFDVLQITPVPLPACAWLMLSGMGGLGLFGRRKPAA